MVARARKKRGMRKDGLMGIELSFGVIKILEISRGSCIHNEMY